MKKISELNDSGKGILFASMTALLWGFLAIFLKVTLKYVDPVTVAWFRFAIAFVLLFLFLYIKDRKSVKILIKPPLLAVVASIGLGFNYVGYIKGVELTTPIRIVCSPQLSGNKALDRYESAVRQERLPSCRCSQNRRPTFTSRLLCNIESSPCSRFR